MYNARHWNVRTGKENEQFSDFLDEVGIVSIPPCIQAAAQKPYTQAHHSEYSASEICVLSEVEKGRLNVVLQSEMRRKMIVNDRWDNFALQNCPKQCISNKRKTRKHIAQGVSFESQYNRILLSQNGVTGCISERRRGNLICYGETLIEMRYMEA